MNIAQLGIIVGVAIAGGLATIGLSLWLHFPLAWVRKLTHVIGMAYVIACAFVFDYKLFVIAGPIFAVLVLAMRFIHPPKALTTKETLDSYGEVLAFVGVTLAALIANSTWHFVIPIAILGLADTAAYVIGRSVKSPKLIFSKSVAGSLAFIVVAFFLLLIVAPWWVALIGAIVTSIAELVGLRGSDNLTIPVVASLLVTFF